MPPGTAQSRKAVVCNQRPGGSREQRLSPLTIHQIPTNFCENLYLALNAFKLLEIVRAKSQECRKARARPQKSVPAASPLSTPRSPPFCRSSRGERGEGVTLHPHRAGAEKCRYSLRFPPAVPPGLTVRSPSCLLCCKGRKYFVREELNLLRLPSGAEFSPLPHDTALSRWTRVFLNTHLKRNCTNPPPYC